MLLPLLLFFVGVATTWTTTRAFIIMIVPPNSPYSSCAAMRRGDSPFIGYPAAAPRTRFQSTIDSSSTKLGSRVVRAGSTSPGEDPDDDKGKKDRDGPSTDDKNEGTSSSAVSAAAAAAADAAVDGLVFGSDPSPPSASKQSSDDGISNPNERARLQRDQLPEILATTSSTLSSSTLSSSSTSSVAQARRLMEEPATSTDGNAINDGDDDDDDDDPFSVTLDTDAYLRTATQMAQDVAPILASSADDDGDGGDNVGLSDVDAQATLPTGAQLDPSYRAVLEALLTGPTARSRIRSIDEDASGIGSIDDDATAGATTKTLQDLVRILEAKNDSRDMASSFVSSNADRLHELVFANEDGFLQQSDKFRKGLTDPTKDGTRQALAEIRSAIFHERNAQSLQRLEEQLDRLQQSIDSATALSSDSTKQPVRCPRCQSVLTPHDVQLMQQRGTRLCPVCVAEVRLVTARNPLSSTTFTPPQSSPTRSSGTTKPASRLRTVGPDRPRRVYYTTRQSVPDSPVPRRPPLGSSGMVPRMVSTAKSSSATSNFRSSLGTSPTGRRDVLSRERLSSPRSLPPEDEPSLPTRHKEKKEDETSDQGASDHESQ